MFEPQQVQIPPLPVTTADVSYPAAATAASVVYAAAGNNIHALSGIIAWSYTGGTPTGTLSIADGSNTIFSIDITAAGPGFIPIGLEGTPGNSMTITLSSGGGGITGKLSIDAHWTRSSSNVYGGWSYDFSQAKNSFYL